MVLFIFNGSVGVSSVSEGLQSCPRILCLWWFKGDSLWLQNASGGGFREVLCGSRVSAEVSLRFFNVVLDGSRTDGSSSFRPGTKWPTTCLLL